MNTEETIIKQAKDMILESQEISENPTLEEIDRLDRELSALISIVNQYSVDYDMKGKKFHALGKDMLEIVRDC